MSETKLAEQKVMETWTIFIILALGLVAGIVREIDVCRCTKRCVELGYEVGNIRPGRQCWCVQEAVPLKELTDVKDH